MAVQSTQSKHPWRASLRTAAVSILTYLPILALVGNEVSEWVEEQWPGSPASAIVVGSVALIGSVSLLVNRIILIPGVASLLDRAGIGPEPKQKGDALTE